MNKFKPHVVILPEDDANRQLALGFERNPYIDRRSILVEEPAGGWTQLYQRFNADHVLNMDRVPLRLMILLVDFDRQANRLDEVMRHVPERLRNRVFVIGSWNNPERLKSELGSRSEEIGSALAEECRTGQVGTWNHELLKHNVPELERMSAAIRPALFP